jgi:hypothetical protein
MDSLVSGALHQPPIHLPPPIFDHTRSRKEYQIVKSWQVSQVVCVIDHAVRPLDINIDADLGAFILDLLRSMGPPYSNPGYTNWRGPRLTLQVRGMKYPLTYADISGSPNTEMGMITFLVTFERFRRLVYATSRRRKRTQFLNDNPVDPWSRNDA